MNEVQAKVMQRYGSYEAAKARFSELSVVGRGLAGDEPSELTDLAAAFLSEWGPAGDGGGGAAAPGTDDAAIMSASMRSIQAWASEKKTPDTILSLAAVVAGWDAEQDDPTMVMELEYQVAIDKAMAIVADCAAKAGERKGGPKKIKVLAHPVLYLAVVIKRLNERESKKLLADMRSDDKIIADNVAAEAFRKAILWPQREVIGDLAEMYPIAIDEVMPAQLVRAAGLVIGGSKKKG